MTTEIPEDYVAHCSDDRITWDATPHQFSATTMSAGKERWSEAHLWIYTEPETYILEIIGASSVPGEEVRASLHVYHTALEIVRAHRRAVPGRPSALPYHIRKVMQDAADAGFHSVTSALSDHDAYRRAA